MSAKEHDLSPDEQGQAGSGTALAELGEGLPDLSADQHAFVWSWAVEGMTIVDAYRKAFPAQVLRHESEGLSSSTLRANAAKLAGRHEIQAWRGQLRRLGFATARVGVEQHISELTELQQRAADEGDWKAAIGAAKLKGQVSGLYETNIRITDERTDPPSVYARLVREVGQEAADRWAERKGYMYLLPALTAETSVTVEPAEQTHTAVPRPATSEGSGESSGEA